jgi:hypothetical protein
MSAKEESKENHGCRYLRIKPRYVKAGKANKRPSKAADDTQPPDATELPRVSVRRKGENRVRPRWGAGCDLSR